MESCGGKRKRGRDKREEGITQRKIGGGGEWSRGGKEGTKKREK